MKVVTEMREAWLDIKADEWQWLDKLAYLIRADEREACAKVCDDWPIGREDVCEIAAFIRARSNR